MTVKKKRRRTPQDEGKFNIWLSTQFEPNLGSVAELLEVSPAKVARVSNDAQVYPYIIDRNNRIRVYKESESKIKKRVNSGKVTDSRPTLPTLTLPKLPDGLELNCGIGEYMENLVQQIVKNPNCTPAIEALLGIELKGEEGDERSLRGEIREINVMLAAVVLKCAMQGYKSYRVFSQRGSDPSFEAIGDSTTAEFEDERPNLIAGQPEKRQYKIIMLEKNKPVGDYSATETVVTRA